MEENNIFLAGGDSLVYLAGSMHKKYSAAFVWGHPLSTYYLMADFSTPLPLVRYVRILDDSSSIPQLRTYLMDGLFLNQKANKNIRIVYSLKCKHLKKKILKKK